MRDPNRIGPILKELGELWKTHPDLRLGQLIMAAADDRSPDIFYLEDDAIITNLKRVLPRRPMTNSMNYKDQDALIDRIRTEPDPEVRRLYIKMLGDLV